jgi:hypothetical protein
MLQSVQIALATLSQERRCGDHPRVTVGLILSESLRDWHECFVGIKIKEYLGCCWLATGDSHPWRGFLAGAVVSSSENAAHLHCRPRLSVCNTRMSLAGRDCFRIGTMGRTLAEYCRFLSYICKIRLRVGRNADAM